MSQQIEILDKLTKDIYGVDFKFRNLTVHQQIVVATIQGNNIKRALLELKSKRKQMCN